MRKKIMVLAITSIIALGVIGLTGCKDKPTILKYESLEELQSATTGYNFYFFDFEVDGIEPGTFSAPARSKGNWKWELNGYDISYVQIQSGAYAQFNVRCNKTMDIKQEVASKGYVFVDEYMIDAVECWIYSTDGRLGTNLNERGVIVFFELGQVGYRITIGQMYFDNEQKELIENFILSIFEPAFKNKYKI